MSPALKKSIALHAIVFVLFVVDLPLFWFNRTTPGQVPIIVDLQDVKISEMTNLPPKAKMGEENKEASQVKRKVEEKYTKEEPKEEPKPDVAPEAEPKPIKQDFLEAPKPEKKPQVKPQPRKPQPKPEPKKPEPKKVEQPKKDTSKPELANPLKSLLASVDALEKEGATDTTARILS